MHKVLLIGNPNVGKSTLFNSLTKSCEHTGTYHGVTVAEKSKTIHLGNEQFEIVDLPGLYSLNTFSFEEEVAKQNILKSKSLNLLIVDANSIKRNLYLALQLKEIGVNFKILVNNFDSFKRKNNCINIDYLAKKLGMDIQIINAKETKAENSLFQITHKKQKLPYLQDILSLIKKEISVEDDLIINVLNGIEQNVSLEDKQVIESFKYKIIL